MKSLLITGGCGFIGSNFIRLLLQNGAEELRRAGYDRILNIDALTYAGNRSNLIDLENDDAYEFHHKSILDQPFLDALMNSRNVAAVIHFAAESHVDRSIDGPEPFIETNVLGTLRLLEAARKHWSELGEGDRGGFRFLHVSTDEVFGSLEESDDAFCETTPYAPNSPYSASKASSDFLVRAYFHTYGLPVVTTNCSNNYGPYQFPEKLIPLILLNALEGRELPVYGDGSNVRDWLYVEDHCRGILAALQCGRLGEVYCIGGRNEMQNIQIVRTVCSLLDELLPIGKNDMLAGKGLKAYAELITFVKDRPGHDKRYAINCEKMEKECGWNPKETFETGIRKTVTWYLENRDWCKDITDKTYARQRLGGV